MLKYNQSQGRAGTRRCDQFALIDGEYFLVEEGGQRFKVASFAPLTPTAAPAGAAKTS